MGICRIVLPSFFITLSIYSDRRRFSRPRIMHPTVTASCVRTHESVIHTTFKANSARLFLTREEQKYSMMRHAAEIATNTIAKGFPPMNSVSTETATVMTYIHTLQFCRDLDIMDFIMKTSLIYIE